VAFSPSTARIGKIHYDRATVLRQLGVLHEPDGMVGRIEAAVMHPLTMAHAIGQKILQRRKAYTPRFISS
jgi:hypothetical protein